MSPKTTPRQDSTSPALSASGAGWLTTSEKSELLGTVSVGSDIDSPS